ncbi:MAG: phage integrase SAM-like domain-containing protein [Bacteroidia bacterium]
MAKLSFILKDRSNHKTLVYLMFRSKSKRIKLSTGEQINANDWNPKTQRPRITRGNLALTELSSLLDSKMNNCQSALYKLKNENENPSLETIKRTLKSSLRGITDNSSPSLLVFAQQLIETTSRKPQTVKNYKLALGKLKSFEEVYNTKLDYADINIDFYNTFLNYLQDQNYSANYVGTIIKNVKVFMNEAFDRGYHTNLEYKNRKFKVLDETTDAVYLNQTELKTIYSLDLSKSPRLEKARDLFIIGCFTGLRFSDLQNLEDKNFIKDNRLIRIKTEKTGEIVNIPVHPFVKSLFDKYEGILPTKISNQKLNDHIKEFVELAGINEKTISSMTKGGVKVQESFSKFELVTTHTARRSFATNAYLNEIPTISIMKITGHKTEKAFLKYIRISNEENAERLLNHEFFK